MSERTIEQRLGDWIIKAATTVDEIAEISGLIVKLKEQELSRGLMLGLAECEKLKGGDS